MGDWAQTQDYNRVTITTGSLESCGAEIVSSALTLTSGNAWPATNRAIFVPFVVFQQFVVVKMFTINGSSSGNIDVGIYDTGQNRLVSAGSTAMAGTNAIQIFDVTDTTLNPGVYYMAVALDNTTGQPFSVVPALTSASAMGVLSQSTAFALPSPATFAAAQDAYVPFIGVTGRTTI